MISIGTVFLLTLSCLGLGAASLKLLKIGDELNVAEHYTISFAAGYGILGWLMFPLGVGGFFSQSSLLVVLIAGAGGIIFLPGKGIPFSRLHLDSVGKVLLAVIGCIGLLHLAEGVSPPADADSLYYHFVLPKQYLQAGKIEFIPTPLTGAAAFLIQLTYVPAVALGQELALTLWTMVTSWAAGALFFVLCRHYLSLNWSLALTILFLTTPAVIYGSGSGQVECRIALFVLLTAWATAKTLQSGQARYAVLAGLGAGFFMASKYTGLLFAGAAGLMVLLQRRWLACGIAFGVAMFASGFQWYAWNAVHTGDPVFPALFQWLGSEDFEGWSKAYDLVFKEKLYRSENPLPHTPIWALLFPFKATLDFSILHDAGRVGFGPYGVLIMPFAVLGVWQHRKRIRQHPLFAYAGLALVFYLLWFFVGGSQRIRHLLPVLPLFLICATVAAQRCTLNGRARTPLLAAVTATLMLQLAGQSLFSSNHVRFVTSGADREAFLTRNIDAYSVVPWINANLKETDRIFYSQRELRYYLKTRIFLANHMQGQIELREEETTPRKAHLQFEAAGVTHFLMSRKSGDDKYRQPLGQLERTGCLTRIKTFHERQKSSRTLPNQASIPRTLDLLRLNDKSCLE